jgi:hypothetical protein
MSRWKAFERRCAVRLGGRRRPVTGLDRGDGDVFTPMFEVQCKLRAGHPAYLVRWLAEVCRTAAARDRIGVVVWKEPGKGRDDGEALVVMRFRDFVDLHGPLADRADERAEAAQD